MISESSQGRMFKFSKKQTKKKKKKVRPKQAVVPKSMRDQIAEDVCPWFEGQCEVNKIFNFRLKIKNKHRKSIDFTVMCV